MNLPSVWYSSEHLIVEVVWLVGAILPLDWLKSPLMMSSTLWSGHWHWTLRYWTSSTATFTRCWRIVGVFTSTHSMRADPYTRILERLVIYFLLSSLDRINFLRRSRLLRNTRPSCQNILWQNGRHSTPIIDRWPDSRAQRTLITWGLVVL